MLSASSRITYTTVVCQRRTTEGTETCSGRVRAVLVNHNPINVGKIYDRQTDKRQTAGTHYLYQPCGRYCNHRGTADVHTSHYYSLPHGWWIGVVVASFVARTKLLYVKPGQYWDG